MRKKLVFSVLCLMILPGAILYAASSPSEVSVYVNQVAQKQLGKWSEEGVFLPVDLISQNLNVLMSLDETGKKVQIYKPNINMVVLDDKGGIFGKIKSPSRIAFSTLVQVDNLKTEVSEIKLTITDPANKTETVDTHQIKEQEDNFWFKSEEYTYSFNTKGTYTIQVYFKEAGSKKWSAVSEIQLFGF